MAYPSDTTGTAAAAAAAAAAGIAHCGSLGVALQQALEEIRHNNYDDDDYDFWNDEDHGDRILEALGTAVAATNNNSNSNSTGTGTGSNSNYDDYDDHDTAVARPFVLTAVVDYYNRLGDRWRIVAVPESAELQVVAPPPPPPDDPLGGDPDDNDASGRTKKRKRQTTAIAITTVQLPRLEVLAYKEDYYYSK